VHPLLSPPSSPGFTSILSAVAELQELPTLLFVPEGMGRSSCVQPATDVKFKAVTKPFRHFYGNRQVDLIVYQIQENMEQYFSIWLE